MSGRSSRCRRSPIEKPTTLVISSWIHDLLHKARRPPFAAHTRLSFPLLPHLPYKPTSQWPSSGPATASPSRRARGRSSSSRKILITAGEGQTGRLIVELLTTDDAYASKYEELTVLLFSEKTRSVLKKCDAVKTVVYDPKDEEAHVQAMSLVDTCLFIPLARKVRPLPLSKLRR